MNIAEQMLERRYNYYMSEVEKCLDQLEHSRNNVEGLERKLLYDTLVQAKNNLITVGQGIKMFAKSIAPFLFIATRRAEQLIRSYRALNEIWTRRLSQNISNLNEDKFKNITIKSIKKEVLEERLHVAKEIHKVIQDAKTICEVKIDLNAEVHWATDDILNLQKALHRLGLNVAKFNLTGKIDKTYDSYYTKDTIEHLGYSIDDIEDLVKSSSELATYVNKKETKKITETISAYFDDLAKQENALHEMQSLDESVKEQKIHEMEMRVIRLWNITSFFKIMQKLTHDIFRDIFKLCREAAATEGNKKENESEY
jgi:rRNA maturation endonuclease Nob1